MNTNFTDKKQNIVVSVVIPIYNEECFIENCIESLLLQDYPVVNIEVIFVDGNSTDKTVSILKDYQNQYPDLIRVLNNPQKIVPYAMNIGIKASKGKYIIRMDAHAEYALDYISKCVFYLENSDADNVGGIANTKANGFVGNCIAKMLSSKFGVGNSRFRTGSKTGYVDTVPFGAFRREVFSNYGAFDERLVRNQDNEMNYRIRKNRGKILLCDEIHFTYYCRDSIKSIIEMALKNGKWNIITYKLCPGSMSCRHFVPLMFILSIIVFPLIGTIYHIFYWLFFGEMSLYLLLDIIFSFKCCSSVKEFFLLLLLFPMFHISYGIGSIDGLICLIGNDFDNGVYKVPKI